LSEPHGPLAPGGITWEEWHRMDEPRRIDPHGMNPPDTPQPAAWWKVFNRSMVLAELETAMGTSIDPNDTLADTLIVTAQGLGILPADLRIWITQTPPPSEWSAENLTRWVELYDLDKGNEPIKGVTEVQVEAVGVCLRCGSKVRETGDHICATPQEGTA
jgi:hypothetical protein